VNTSYSAAVIWGSSNWKSAKKTGYCLYKNKQKTLGALHKRLLIIKIPIMYQWWI